MNQQVFYEIIYPIIIAIVTGLTALIGYGFKYLFKYLDTKIGAMENEEDRKILESVKKQAEDHISTAVVKTNQVLVENLKSANADGRLTPEEITQAFSQTYVEAKSLMGQELYVQLKQYLPDVEVWIRSKIELYVNLNK